MRLIGDVATISRKIERRVGFVRFPISICILSSVLSHLSSAARLLLCNFYFNQARKFGLKSRIDLVLLDRAASLDNQLHDLLPEMAPAFQYCACTFAATPS